jgi:hypothetical protein
LFEQYAHVKNSSLHSERLRRAPMGRLDWLQGKTNPAISRETVSSTAKNSFSRGPLETVTSTVLNSGGIQALKTELLSTAAYRPAPKPPLTPYASQELADVHCDDTHASDLNTFQDEQEPISEDSQRADIRRLHQVRTRWALSVLSPDLTRRSGDFSLNSTKFGRSSVARY